MNNVKKVLSTLGGVLLAALLIAALAPKATHGLVAALVQVANTNSSPVPTAEALGTETLLQFSCPSQDAGEPAGILGSAVCYTVPAGKRAVIEQVDGSCNLPKGDGVIALTSIEAGGTAYNLPMQLQPDLGDVFGFDYLYYEFNQPVRIYVDAGGNIAFNSLTSDTKLLASCYFNVSGRLVPTS